MMFSPVVIPILSYLPFTASFRAIYRRGWESRERYNAHLQYGDLFTMVTPSGILLYVCDNTVVHNMLKRKDDFTRDFEAFAVLDIFGKSLATTDGADWNRHKKVAGVTFTEKNNELVWCESLKEASQMLDYWVNRAPTPIRTLKDDGKVFTLNVLAAALYGKSYPFESRDETKARLAREGKAVKKKDTAFAYRDSLVTILTTLVPIMVFGEKTLRKSWWLPDSWRKAGYAVSDFRSYVTDLINEERELIAQGKQNSPNLVTNLVRACEEEDDGTLETENGGAKPGKRAILTKDEIISDLFVFAFAGNDTTAVTLTYLMAELAANPHIQDWLSEEIRYYTTSSDCSKWDYATCMKFKRCWATVYEILRLSHPLGQLSKTTGAQPRAIPYNDKMYLIPAKTMVLINLPALQTHPQYWDDGLTWSPKRFITGSSIENEVLPADTSDSFFPWSFGKLACPGKRFSQVELVAVLAALFRDHRVEPVPEGGENMSQARARVGKLAMDVELRLLNELAEPEKVGLRWYKVAS